MAKDSKSNNEPTQEEQEAKNEQGPDKSLDDTSPLDPASEQHTAAANLERDEAGNVYAEGDEGTDADVDRSGQHPGAGDPRTASETQSVDEQKSNNS